MATLGDIQSKDKQKKTQKSKTFSVGEKQLDPHLALDESALKEQSWLVRELPTNQARMQVSPYVLDVTRPTGLVIHIVNANGEPVDADGNVVADPSGINPTKGAGDDTVRHITGDKMVTWINGYCDTSSMSVVDTSAPASVTVVSAKVKGR